MAVGGINHITLSAGDVQQTVRFYSDVLGCEVLATWPKGAYLLAGTLWVAIVEGADETREPADYSHVAFHASPADLREIEDRARTWGVEFWQKNWTEGDSIYLTDPAGHRLEVHSNTLLDRLRHAVQQPWDGLSIASGAIQAVANASGSTGTPQSAEQRSP